MEKQNIESLIKDEKKRYYKAWRSQNRDKVKQHNQNFWAKRAQKHLDTEQKGE